MDGDIFCDYCEIGMDSANMNIVSPPGSNIALSTNIDRCDNKLHRKNLLSRWSRVVTVGLALTLTSCLYSGWQSFSVALINSGKYTWLCEDSNLDSMNNFITGGHHHSSHGNSPILFSHAKVFTSTKIQCDAQRYAIDRLYAIAAAWEFFGGIVGGILLDLIGPRRTALFGESLGFIALVMISSVPSHLQRGFSIGSFHCDLLKISFALTGSAVNIISYPGLVLEDYFTDAAAQCAAFNVACQTLSAAVAPVVSLIILKGFSNMTLIDGWFYYATMIWLPAAVLYVIAMPTRRPKLMQDKFQPLDSNRHVPDSTESRMPESSMPLVRTYDDRSFDIVSSSPGPLKKTEKTLGQCCSAKAKDVYICLRDASCTSEFICLILVNGVLTIQGAYYQMECRNTFGDSLSNYLGWIIPLQSIFTLLLAMAARTLKSAKMAMAILTGFALNYLIASMGIANLTQYINAFLFVVSLSYSYNIKYTYVEENYPVDHYGTLLGFTSLTGGVFVLATQIFVETLTPRVWFVILAMMSGAMFPLTIYLDFKSGLKTLDNKSL